MNYKEKYEDMFDKLSTLLDDCKKKGHIIARVEDIEAIFPELKEGEDEKIRKKLIDLIYKVYTNTNYLTCKEHERFLSWLEKQGEQKPVEWSEEDEQYLRKAIEGTFDRGYLSTSNWLKSLKDRVGCEANCTTTKEWSEKDEKIKEELSEFLDEVSHLGAKVNFNRWTTSQVADWIVWCSKLKNRIVQ